MFTGKDTPFAEIFLSKDELKLLKSLTDGCPHTYDELCQKLLSHNLVAPAFDFQNGLKPKQIYISSRGIDYLKFLSKSHIHHVITVLTFLVGAITLLSSLLRK